MEDPKAPREKRVEKEQVQDSGATGARGGQFQERRWADGHGMQKGAPEDAEQGKAGNLLESVCGWQKGLPACHGCRRMPLFCKLGNERKYQGLLLVLKMGGGGYRLKERAGKGKAGRVRTDINDEQSPEARVALDWTHWAWASTGRRRQHH